MEKNEVLEGIDLALLALVQNGDRLAAIKELNALRTKVFESNRQARRDMFAAAALKGLMASPFAAGHADDFATNAVKYADALIAALDAGEGE